MTDNAGATPEHPALNYLSGVHLLTAQRRPEDSRGYYHHDAPGRDFGAPTPRGSILRKTAGAGSSGPSTITPMSCSAGTSPSSAIAGPRSSRFGRACGRPSTGSAKRSPVGSDPLRLGTAVHRRRLDQRSEVARDHNLAVLRRRARVQRCHRALHAHAQGAVHLSPPVPELGAGAADHRGFHPPLTGYSPNRTFQHFRVSRKPGAVHYDRISCPEPVLVDVLVDTEGKIREKRLKRRSRQM